MSFEFRMPAMGADMEAGTLLEWKFGPGDHVLRGDVIAVIETEKGAIDIEVFHEGDIERLLVTPGTRVPVGEPLAILSGDGGPDVGGPGAIASTSTATQPTTGPAHAVQTTRRPRISPAARRRAGELGLDPATLRGTGPGGAVSLADVELAAGPPRAPAASAAQTPMRAIIAAAMARSKREIPHYYVSTTLDYTPVVDWLSTRNAAVPVERRILPVVPLLRAVALTASQLSGFNGHYVDGSFTAAESVHLGIAVALRGGGVVTPSILGAGTMDLPALMAALNDLVQRARKGGLRASELASGTITVTSLGDDGVDSVQPIIYPPQVAIVGAGAIAERPWVVSGRVVPRHVITLTLAADHRVTDGRTGARFLHQVGSLLSRPEAL